MSGQRGYDYDLEIPFWEDGGVRYLLGSVGSMIVICPTCGEEHFRERPKLEFEHCFKGHGQMEFLTMENRKKYNALWIAGGGTLTTVDERRQNRLEREAKLAKALGLDQEDKNG